MINDLDETLKQLLVQEGGLGPSVVDINFDVPTRDWATQAVQRPTINLYLFDVRENRQLREMGWEQQANGNGKVRLKRLPIRIDLSYMITCWTSDTMDQHRLLWRVLETLFRHSPLPSDTLHGALRQLVHPVRTEVAQPDGILKNVSDFWGALDNQLRPSINLVVTLELDLEQVEVAPLVLTHLIKVGHQAVDHARADRAYPLERLVPDWATAAVQIAGIVHDTQGRPLDGATVGLLSIERDGQRIQVGPHVQTDSFGRYKVQALTPGEFTLVIEALGRQKQEHPLTIATRERGEPIPVQIHDVEVPMA